MGIKEELEQVRSKLTEEQVAAIGSVLKSIENEVLDLQSSLTAANSESKNRKIKIREMEEKIQDYDVKESSWQKQVEDLNKKLEDDTKDEKINNLQSRLNSFLKRDQDSFKSSFENITKHPNWEKAKGRFKLPEKDEKGELTWDKLDDKQWEHNITSLNDLNDLGYFGEIKNAPNVLKGGGTPKDANIQELTKLREQLGVNHPQYIAAIRKAREAGVI